MSLDLRSTHPQPLAKGFGHSLWPTRAVLLRPMAHACRVCLTPAYQHDVALLVEVVGVEQVGHAQAQLEARFHVRLDVFLGDGQGLLARRSAPARPQAAAGAVWRDSAPDGCMAGCAQ